MRGAGPFSCGRGFPLKYVLENKQPEVKKHPKDLASKLHQSTDLIERCSKTILITPVGHPKPPKTTKQCRHLIFTWSERRAELGRSGAVVVRERSGGPKSGAGATLTAFVSPHRAITTRAQTPSCQCEITTVATIWSWYTNKITVVGKHYGKICRVKQERSTLTTLGRSFSPRRLLYRKIYISIDHASSPWDGRQRFIYVFDAENIYTQYQTMGKTDFGELIDIWAIPFFNCFF